MKNLRKKLLIPSIGFEDARGLKKLSGRFPLVEVNLFGLDPKLPPREIERLKATKKRLDEAGVQVYSVHLKGFDLSQPGDIAMLDGAVMHCNIVHEIFKPEIAVLHPGHGDMEDLLDNLDVVARQIPESMTITIENMTAGKHVLHSPETVKAFVEGCERLPQNVGVCIDTAHPGFESEPIDTESYTALVLEYLQSALPRLGHLHFSDRGADGDKHLAIGDGVIDWQQVDNFLQDNGYEGHAAVEIRYREETVDKTIRSICAYPGNGETDLNTESESRDMEKMDKADFLARLAELPSATPIPASISKILNLPEDAMVEQTEEYTYFIVPSDRYEKKHADPFDVLSGESIDRLDWADYIFGVRYNGSYLSAVLIDKERRIAVCDSLLYLPDAGKMDWTRFEEAMKTALEYAKTESPNPQMKTDHVVVTSYGGVKFVYVMEELAWGQD